MSVANNHSNSGIHLHTHKTALVNTQLKHLYFSCFVLQFKAELEFKQEFTKYIVFTLINIIA